MNSELHTTGIRAPKRDAAALGERVYQHLVEQLIQGTIQYGQSLSIKQLAAELGVSTMPIRDAIKRLEMEGMVVVKPRSVCYVRKPTKRSTVAAIDAREMLETQAVGMYCRTVREQDLVRLKEILEEMRPMAAAAVGPNGDCEPDLHSYIQLDHEFHAELCRLAGNMYIDRFYREISMHLNMSFRYGKGVCHGIVSTFREHEEICTGLSRNSRRAIAVLRRHLRQSKRNIIGDPAYQNLPE